jgi:hypothetical protein
MGADVMTIIIDRFEGDFAVVETEDKKMINLPQLLVPHGAKEGSVLSIELNTGETETRKRHSADLMKNVWKD